jgi:uncharacterized membrane protein
MDHAFDHLPTSTEMPRVRSVDIRQPLVWLHHGFADMHRLGRASLAYGVFVAAVGMLLLWLAWGATYLVPAAIGGFLLVAPFAAIGLYALSQQLESGRAADPAAAVFAWRRNATSIGLFGLVLALALLLWERLAAIVFALFVGEPVPDPANLLAEIVFSGQHVPLLLAFCGVGALLAAAVFALSVVSAPLLLDRPVDVVTAVLTSLRCCARNPAAMLLWAALIAGVTAIGFATFMLGLVVLFPWLGHASWHAYRDLVE